ncbi:reverse transcriptase domain-containing protein [Tanacetum coccineum]
MGWAYEFHQDRASSVKFPVFATGVPVGPVFLLGLLALAIDAACAFRAEEMPSLISCWMAAKVMAGVSDVDVPFGSHLSTEDNYVLRKKIGNRFASYYDGKGGAVVLTHWIERMETVIDNSGCVENQKVRYVTSSLVNKALTWWNTQVQARGREAENAMSWNDFKALLVEEFCPSNEMERMENEFWNHKMIGANHAGYTDRFQELAKLVPHLDTPEYARIKRYMVGLAPEIRGMLKATQPATIQSAILKAGILTDEVVNNGTLTKGSEKRKSVGECNTPIFTI